MCPMYDYQCDDCKALEEVIVPLSECDEPRQCGTCGGEMHKCLSAPKGIDVKGPGSFDGHERFDN